MNERMKSCEAFHIQYILYKIVLIVIEVNFFQTFKRLQVTDGCTIGSQRCSMTFCALIWEILYHDIFCFTALNLALRSVIKSIKHIKELVTHMRLFSKTKAIVLFKSKTFSVYIPLQLIC